MQQMVLPKSAFELLANWKILKAKLVNKKTFNLILQSKSETKQSKARIQMVCRIQCPILGQLSLIVALKRIF